MPHAHPPDRVPESVWLPYLLQTTDSFFPAGAYAHSFGLEALVQWDTVRDAESLGRCLDQMILPSLRCVELPWVALSYRAAERELWSEVALFAEACGAMRGSRELREASAKLGAQRLELLRQIHPDPRWELFAAALASLKAAPHFPMVQAVQAVIAGVPRRACLTAAYYQGVTGVLSASLKLIRIGQMAVQGLLTQALLQCESVVAEADSKTIEEIGWFNPILDIASAQHEYAYTRVFIS